MIIIGGRRVVGNWGTSQRTGFQAQDFGLHFPVDRCQQIWSGQWHFLGTPPAMYNPMLERLKMEAKRRTTKPWLKSQRCLLRGTGNI